MTPLRDQAELRWGRLIARTYQGELSRLERLLPDSEVVQTFVEASHWAWPGILVVTDARCLFAVKRYFHWYQTRDLPFTPDRQLLIGKRGGKKYWNLGFSTETESSYYWIGLGLKLEDPRCLAEQIARLTIEHGGEVIDWRGVYSENNHL